jgi:hypothetical protein
VPVAHGLPERDRVNVVEDHVRGHAAGAQGAEPLLGALRARRRPSAGHPERPPDGISRRAAVQAAISVPIRRPSSSARSSGTRSSGSLPSGHPWLTTDVPSSQARPPDVLSVAGRINIAYRRRPTREPSRAGVALAIV